VLTIRALVDCNGSEIKHFFATMPDMLLYREADIVVLLELQKDECILQNGAVQNRRSANCPTVTTGRESIHVAPIFCNLLQSLKTLDTANFETLYEQGLTGALMSFRNA
jgi:hypothetical protein